MLVPLVVLGFGASLVDAVVAMVVIVVRRVPWRARGRRSAVAITGDVGVTGTVAVVGAVAVLGAVAVAVTGAVAAGGAIALLVPSSVDVPARGTVALPVPDPVAHLVSRNESLHFVKLRDAGLRQAGEIVASVVQVGLEVAGSTTEPRRDLG